MYGSPWSAIQKRHYPGLPRTVALGDGDEAGIVDHVNLECGVTILGGLNGTSKTRTLRAMASSMETDGALLVQAASLVAWIRAFLADRADAADFGEELAWHELDSNELRVAQSLVCRDYSTVEWASIEFDDSPFEAIVGVAEFPLFRARYGEIEYETESMGDGELACLILLWVLWMLEPEGNDGPLLLDEPDALLSGPSRSRLIDHLVALSAETGRVVIATSHSAELLLPASRVDGSLRLLISTAGALRCVDDPGSCRDLVDQMFAGGSVGSVVFFVEDEAASHFLLELLRALDLRLFLRSSVFWLRGHGDVQRAVGDIPMPAGFQGPVLFVGLVDGDASHLTAATDAAWPILALPGEAPPEDVLRTHIQSVVGELAARASISVDRCSALLAQVEGAELHGWLNGLVAGLGLPRSEAIALVFRCVIDGPGGNALLDEFRDELERVKLLDAIGLPT